MKKNKLLAGLLAVFVLLSACGAEENEDIVWRGVAPGMEDLTAITDRTEYYDIAVESEEIFDVGLWEQNPKDDFLQNILLMGGTVYVPLGTQFYRGEPVQLWALARPGSSDIYLYGKDGEAKQALQNVSAQYTDPGRLYRWHMDRDGNFYCSRAVYVGDRGRERAESTLVKLLPTGEVLFESTLEPGLVIEDLCQLEEGGIVLLLKDEKEERRLLAQADPETGTVTSTTEVGMLYECRVQLGTAGDFPALIGCTDIDNGYEIAKVNLADGSLSPVLYLTGTSYSVEQNGKSMRDFRVLEDGRMEVLWTDLDGVKGTLERLEMGKVEKTPITVRGNFSEAWMGERAALFNRRSSAYHVVLESCGGGNDREDFARLTSVQIAAGKGPDILCGAFFLRDYIDGMLKKGAVEELNSYMEASGVREEDYFPFVFATWRDGERIYGINPLTTIYGYQIDGEVLGGREEPDVEALADALLAREGVGLYLRGADSSGLLKTFLEGTEDLWGMVDWENGSCDFGDPLFYKLLEVAARYGDDGTKSPESALGETKYLFSVFDFESLAQREEKGKVSSGVLFDDGCHVAAVSSDTMVINANSPHKEGAWEFIRFLLGEEAQTLGMAETRGQYLPAPVNRKAYDQWLELEIEKVREDENDITKVRMEGFGDYYKVSEEKKAEYKRAFEEARPCPTRALPVLAIVLEEAGDYFTGSKSADEVVDVINNRVRLYLAENR